LTTLDLSRRYEESLQRAADHRGMQLRQAFLERADDPFPFADQSFPIGIASQVFLHVPDTLIERTFSEFLRVCREVVVISLYANAFRGQRLPGHVFAHDYPALASRHGFELNHTIVRDGRIYFSACPT
jgi:hypothetical protein